MSYSVQVNALAYISDKMPPTGEEFSYEKPIHLSRYCMSILRHYGRQHLYVWISTGPKPDYGFITNANELDIVVAFNSQESINVFHDWMIRYANRFSVNTINNLDEAFEVLRQKDYPRLPEREASHGTLVAHSYPQNEWNWVVSNCKGKVWFLDRHIMFENDEDAVFYKLSKGKAK